MNVDSGLIAQIASVVLAVLAVAFGAKYRKAKKLLEDMSKAIEDNKITEQEVQQIEDDIESLRE